MERSDRGIAMLTRTGPAGGSGFGTWLDGVCFPLTDVQRAYWLGRGNWFPLGNIGCHVYFEFELPPLDAQALQAAWRRLIDRHPMLRAVVQPDGTQRVLDHVPAYELLYNDLRNAAPPRITATLQDTRDVLSHQLFAPDRWPLFDLRLSSLRERAIFHFSLDLLFVDLWSMQILFDELTQLLQDPDVYLAPIDYSFGHYILDTLPLQSGLRHERAEQYWAARIDTMPPAPPLPQKAGYADVAQPHFVRLEQRLGILDTAVLRRHAAKAGLTPSGVLMAAFARSLAGWSGSDHFVLNNTFFLRQPVHADMHAIVGDFTSIQLIEVAHDPEEPFLTFALRLASQLRRDFEHRDYSGIEVMRRVLEHRGSLARELMPVVFTSALSPHMHGWQAADNIGELIYGITQTPQVSLDHQVYERGGRLHLTWDYVEQLFEANEIAKVFARYAAFVSRLAADETAWETPAEPREPANREPAYPKPADHSAAASGEAMRGAGPVPLTDIQLARVAQHALGSTHFVALDGPALDPARLERAWARLTERHDVLRVIAIQGEQQRTLDPPPRYRIPFRDLAAIPAEEASHLLVLEATRIAERMFAAGQWPRYEVLLCRTAPDRSRLLLGVDGGILDRSSLRRVLHEWALLYHDQELPRLGQGLHDHVLACHAAEADPAQHASRDDWRTQLADLGPAPQLPLAREPGTLGSLRWETQTATLKRDDWQRLRGFGRTHGIEPSCIVLAVFAEVLAGWAREPRFTISLLRTRSPIPDTATVRGVGDFTATLLLEIDCDAAATFLELALAVQSQLRENLRHATGSGERTLHDSAGARQPVPIVLTDWIADDAADPPPEAGPDVPPLGEMVTAISRRAQAWLDHQVFEDSGILQSRWNVQEGLFPNGLVSMMLTAFRQRLDMLSRDERRWRDPPRPAGHADAEPITPTLSFEPPHLQAPFLYQAARHPDRPAVISGEQTVSYGALSRQARRLARSLAQLFPCAGSPDLHMPVAIVMDKGWEQVAAAIAVLETGAPYVPIDPDWPAERRAAVLQTCDVAVVLTQPWLAERLVWPASVRVHPVAWQETGPLDDALAEPALSGGDLAYIIFTSGSTGTPKGVMIEHASALNTILDVNARFAVTDRDRVLALSSLSFDLSVYDIFGTLAAGGAIVVPEPEAPRDAAAWLDLVQRHDVTMWNSVPALLQLLADRLQDRPASAPGSLRLALLSGDWIPLALPDRIRTLIPGMEVTSLGGATEASIWSIAYPIGAVDPAWRSIPYGRAMAGQTVQVLDQALVRCPIWKTGEIHIGGIGLARGYWRDEARTDERFILCPRTGARLYRTGDLGRYLPGGEIEILGREDLQVKLQGYRIELGEIETQLRRLPGVAEAVVTLGGAQGGSRHLAAHVLPAALDAARLRDALGGVLPAYMVPTVWQTLDTLPLTANGKVDRAALAAFAPVEAALPCPAEPDDGNAGQGASDAVVREIIALISSEFGSAAIGPRDNLLALGASSLDIVRIVGRFENRFGFRPSIEEFFNNPSVEALARLVHARRNAAASSTAARPAAPSRRTLELIVDPAEREAFHDEHRARRHFPPSWGRVPLPRLAESPGSRPIRGQEPGSGERRSVRHFGAQPIPLATLGEWLAVLIRQEREGFERRAYASAGGCYPVQTYLHIKGAAVTGCAAGLYYYDPEDHALVPLAVGFELGVEAHDPFVNRDTFGRAAFSVFLVDQPGAIEPLYGDLARRFSTLEAGAMAHALETAAPACGLGVCAIGWLDFSGLRTGLQLDEGQELLHSFLGGPLSAADGEWEELIA